VENFDDAPEAAPGWYPMPDGKQGKRYWDGQKWSGDEKSNSSAGSIVLVLVILAFVVLLGVAFSHMSEAKNNQPAQPTEPAQPAEPVQPAQPDPASQPAQITADNCWSLDQSADVLNPNSITVSVTAVSTYFDEKGVALGTLVGSADIAPGGTARIILEGRIPGLPTTCKTEVMPTNYN
jgi:hypothetical protein